MAIGQQRARVHVGEVPHGAGGDELEVRVGLAVEIVEQRWTVLGLGQAADDHRQER